MKSNIKLMTVMIFAIILPTGPATGQILRIGHCPSFSALKDFEMDKVRSKIAGLS